MGCYSYIIPREKGLTLINVNIVAKENEKREYIVPFIFKILYTDTYTKLKFDTGAVNTVVHAQILSFKPKGKEEYNGKLVENKIIELYNKKGIDLSQDNNTYRRKFYAASGGDFYGYLTRFDDVKIDGFSIPAFYLYMVPQNDKIIALLGNDFLRYCQYYHNIEGDIIITKIDENKYLDDYQHALSINDIDELLTKSDYEIADDFDGR